VTIQKLLFKPGINRDNTALTAKGGWFECDKIRFRSGVPEKIGGWTRDFTVTEEPLKPTNNGSFWGVGRWMFTWQTLAGINPIVYGTNSKLYLQSGSSGTITDITPLRYTTKAGDVTFTANTIGLTAIVTVNCTNHGCTVNDFVTFSGAVSLGGNITAAVLNSEFLVTSITTNTFTINVGVNATVADTGTGGGSVIGTFQIHPGPDITYSVAGWGAGTWGSGVWGNTSSNTASSNTQLWSGCNYGEALITNPRYGGLYIWSPDPASVAIVNRATLLTQQTFTVSNANPGVITLTSALEENTSFVASTNGALPTNLVAGTTYYLVNVSGLTANFSATFAGPPINTTAGAQTGVHALAVADCPTVCSHVTVSDGSRFILAFGVNDFNSSVRDPMLVRWSDQENYNIWTPAITNQAGSFRLSRGSEIQTSQQTRQEVLVWTDAALYSMQYLGPPYVWKFDILADNISIASPNSTAVANNITYWMGVDKFYIYSGRVESLSCTLRQYIFGDLNLSQRFQFFAGTNEGFHEIWWFYCSKNSTTIDRYAIYNYLEGVWAYGNLARTAWLDSPYLAAPIALNYDGQILYHEDGNDDGSTNPATPLAAYVQSADFDIGDGDHYAYVDSLIPDLCFDGSTAVAPEVTLTVKPRQNPGAAYGAAPSNPDVASVNDYSVQNNYLVQRFTEFVYVRVRGRQMAFKIESTALGTTWQMGATRINIRPDGRRR
jgi:hypothetical protein